MKNKKYKYIYVTQNKDKLYEIKKGIKRMMITCKIFLLMGFILYLVCVFVFHRYLIENK